MNRRLRWTIAVLIGGSVALSPAGCMSKTSSGKSDTGNDGAAAKKKKSDEPPVRVEEKYGFTSQGAGG